MSSVLLVETEGESRETTYRALACGGHAVSVVSTFPEGIELLKDEDFDVVVTELNGECGVPLMKELAQCASSAQAVLTCSTHQPQAQAMVEKLGAVRVLHRPFSDEELIEAVDHAHDCSEGFHGNIHGIGLVDLLQIMHYSRRSISIHVGFLGAIHLLQGEIIHASFGEEIGSAALQSLLLLKSGTIMTSPLMEVVSTVSSSFQGLLLDVLRRVDESQRDCILDDFSTKDDPLSFASPASAHPPSIPATCRFIPETQGALTRRSRSTLPEGSVVSAACARLVGRIPLGVEASVINLEKGAVLGMHWSGVGMSNEDVLSSAQGICQGHGLRSLLERSDEKSVSNDPQEVRIASDHLIHFVLWLSKPHFVLYLVTSRDANPGMCWVELKDSQSIFEAAIS